MNIKENDLIVRKWPSGRLTMGKAVFDYQHKDLMFYSLENYESEGGVTSNQIYGYINHTYNERLATEFEIDIFKQRGYLKLNESELTILIRDQKLKRLV